MSDIVFTNGQDLEVQQYDLSIGQKELWFIHSMDGAAKAAYNEQLIYKLKGFLSINSLKKAFQALIDKHPILRTSFVKDSEGNVSQWLHQQAELNFTVTNEVNHEQLEDYINQQISKPFHLDQAPLMRVVLVKMNEDEFTLLIVLHHIITDGTSFSILIDDLNQFYNQAMRGEAIQQPEFKPSYFDHIQTEQKQFLSQAYQEKVNTVAESLKGYSGLNFLTTPQGKEKIDIFSGNRVYFKLDKTTCNRLNEFAQAHRMTVFHVLYAAYCIFLSQYTRSQDILVGVPFANREHDLERQIMGYFINTLPIRVTIKEQESFLELASRVKSLVFSSLCKQEVAFEHIASQLNLARKASGQHPIIQTMFVWANTAKVTLRLEGISVQPVHHYFSKTAKFDLSLFMLEESKDDITAYFEYRDALFERETIERIARSFTILLKNILNNPQELVQSLSLLDAAEMQRMKEKYFTAKLDRVVTTSLAELFQETVTRHPKEIGLVFGSQCYDYATIEERSNQWASYIRHQYKQLYGCELCGDTLVALCVDRNEDMIFGMLGILKAGAAYVPVDPKYPQERINYIINHSQASLLLTHKVHDALNLDFAAERIIYMDDDCIVNSPHFVDQPFEHKIKPQDLAYVLYTSGSTGKPKGVGVSHENVICLFESLKKQFEFSTQDVWSLFHTFCFDISVWEIWGAFLFGGTLLVIPYEVTRDTKQFYQLIDSEKVTVLTQTASAFQMFINEDLRSSKKLNYLRYVSFVGESLKVSILRPWVAKYGVDKPRLANMYGITETTVYTNNKFVTQADIDKGRDNIGWPLAEFSMCVMDEHLRWCPVGIVGEICIGGRGLSRGYLYRDDLTQEKFVKDPYANFLGLPEDTRLYRTGDLGRWMEDGSIEYLGRKDFQIKLRGFRIELGEIESALGSYPGITHTAVLLKGEGEAAYLAAYYTLKIGVQVDVANLKSHLKAFLPEYMVPSTFTELVSFPMTVNGKIDRKVLGTVEDKVNIEKNVVPLNTPLEVDIAAVWADIFKLRIDDLGASSNFFELGGNSLLVVKMLTLVSNKIGKELSLSQFIAMPTITSLAAQVESSLTSMQRIHLFKEKLEQDVVLDSAIKPLPDSPCVQHPQSILLTGAAGFVGAHLLDELLKKTDAIIYCLIRAATVDEALEKLTGKLRKYRLESRLCKARIVPVLGDLGERKLGLAAQNYERLTQEVDAIFHVGAWVHHVYDYNTLYKTNVQSVIEIIKMAVTNKNKAIHFVSTLATRLISPIERLSSIDSTSMEGYLNMNGYLTTKWVAEQLLQEAAIRGVVAHVYRPGNVVSGMHGIYEPETNHTLLRLKGMLQLEKGFIVDQDRVEMMPVDLLAAAIVEIAKAPQRFSYNLNNSESISWFDYLKIAQHKGYRFDFISDKEEWNRIMSDIDEQNALYKLSHVYKLHSSMNKGPAETLEITPDYPITTPPYLEMIEQQFNFLIASGFLDSPQTISI
ncbi:non-ribosomal peptide synthetase [Legionella jamestowniensis]|uniref:Non-ribosomal peptide synthetase/polyketide synthetase n=1 Tax=Legionella jamestowniensis TaxID=455 RepID=A0A0W0UH89_9GAMM|nr:non-ribosomal peptide synthetase [Legionella jamestowniensis]KTD07264.1 non-ribosomal peptide synthetase/polyketide synthetase [Legionella jamestowniensis]SFL95482.1 amino acid adenylation domain-containing protein/thioester reductase domain-containing protein [Legionella jamestowniensis DSM 19215]